MRIYLRATPPDLAEGLIGLLIETRDAPPGEIWLISPWLRDVSLPVRGHFASVFGGHREQVPLSEILARLARRHRLTVLTKPPAELIPLAQVRRLADLVETRSQMLAEEEVQGYEVVNLALEALKREAAALAAEATRHAETLRMGRVLSSHGAQLFYLERLHAKLLWTPAGALLGSANFTGGGFGVNEELMAEVTTDREKALLADAAGELVRRGVPAAEYDPGPALRKLGIAPWQLLEWRARFSTAGYAELDDLLHSLTLPPGGPAPLSPK